MFGAIAVALTGLAFGLSLIVAIGPQNTYVLRQGVLRRHVPVVVSICAASDIVLIAAGVAGAGAVLAGRADLLTGARIGGVVFLVGYAGLSAGRALRSTSAVPEARGRETRTAVAATSLALTWLNPWVYVDTLLLLGTVAAGHPGRQWWFGAGAAVASVAWFAGLGFGARVLAPVFARPVAWRVLDGFVALVMLATAVRMALS